jgi:hypothetical protein
MAAFAGGLAIKKGSAKDQVAGMLLTETFLLCDRAAQKTHSGKVVFFHQFITIKVASGKFIMADREA